MTPMHAQKQSLRHSAEPILNLFLPKLNCLLNNLSEQSEKFEAVHVNSLGCIAQKQLTSQPEGLSGPLWSSSCPAQGSTLAHEASAWSTCWKPKRAHRKDAEHIIHPNAELELVRAWESETNSLGSLR